MRYPFYFFLFFFYSFYFFLYIPAIARRSRFFSLSHALKPSRKKKKMFRRRRSVRHLFPPTGNDTKTRSADYSQASDSMNITTSADGLSTCYSFPSHTYIHTQIRTRIDNTRARTCKSPPYPRATEGPSGVSFPFLSLPPLFPKDEPGRHAIIEPINQGHKGHRRSDAGYLKSDRRNGRKREEEQE